MNAPLVTVAMSAYNASATIDLALRSILTQTYQNWELIVVDDGSTDSTREIVSFHAQDPRIRFIQEPSGNRGLAARLNQCVRLARGQYVARMDADDVAYPHRLERQVQFLEEHRDIDLLGTGAVIFKGEGEIIGCYPTAGSHEAICRRPWWGFPLAHPTWMGKRAWFLSHPYSDEDTRCEDQALLLQSFSHSRFAALEEVLLGYRVAEIAAARLGRGRLNYCRRLVERVRDLSSLRWAMMGFGVHSAALARDLALQLGRTVGSGSRRSWGSAGQAEKDQWQSVWAGLARDHTVLHV
ncbi:MAG TPA: glycosyltransferase family 2 protein [Nitrospira sp.]|nr:glycosyltransferase family 2 protein [Nitrospira sp.]